MEVDYLLVGGGLANALIALALREQRPAAKVAIVEREAHLGGNHAWSFHDSDVPPALARVCDSLIEHRWPGYAVRFPGFERALALPYASFGSAKLDQVVRARLDAPGCAVLSSATASRIGAREVELAGGRTIAAQVVIDARGPERLALDGRAGYLKFLGLEVKLARAAAPPEPVIMDATVPQTDGFRFFYLLPYAPDRMLIEDNYYSDRPEADWPRLREAVREYAEARGLPIACVEREEHGVLPLPWALADRSAPAASGDGPLAAGYGGGWFHPATSYSLPVAARLACHVAETPIDRMFGPELAALTAELKRQQAFAQRLNWLLFRGTPPAGRWKVMGGFYRHPEATIRRFYALALTPGDRFRILRVGAWALARALIRPEAA